MTLRATLTTLAALTMTSTVAVIASGHLSNSIGGPAMLRFTKEPASPWDRRVWQQITAGDTTFKAQLRSEPGLHSDHQPFMMAGVPFK